MLFGGSGSTLRANGQANNNPLADSSSTKLVAQQSAMAVMCNLQLWHDRCVSAANGLDLLLMAECLVDQLCACICVPKGRRQPNELFIDADELTDFTLLLPTGISALNIGEKENACTYLEGKGL
ncbi:hypothetical protein J3459_012147 [Metarhizium acridum]|uniref:uncharacterized protein n=1 Tax=Metarhizium acridum TaxID=92637 RepID=UPI001C6CD760|nr:hypothetical protein J3459_012147 [Metarhizium acridum]KAG8425663.1 hypothetical protein J3458_002343 [Metarhizium acridum]